MLHPGIFFVPPRSLQERNRSSTNIDVQPTPLLAPPFQLWRSPSLQGHKHGSRVLEGRREIKIQPPFNRYLMFAFLHKLICMTGSEARFRQPSGPRTSTACHLTAAGRAAQSCRDGFKLGDKILPIHSDFSCSRGRMYQSKSVSKYSQIHCKTFNQCPSLIFDDERKKQT